MWRGETQSGVIDRLSAHLCQTSHPDEIENKGFSWRLSARIPSIFSFPLQCPPSFFSYIFFFPPLFPPSPPLSKVRGINLLQLIALEHFIEQMHSSLLLHFPPLTLLFFLTPFFFHPQACCFCSSFASFPIPFLNQKKKKTVTVYYPLIIMFPWHVLIVFTLRF